MNEQENIRKLQNRNIFAEIKNRVVQIYDTSKIKEVENMTYNEIIDDVFGDD